MSSEDIYEDMEYGKKNLTVPENVCHVKAVTAPDNDEGKFPVPEKVFYITTPDKDKSNKESSSDKKMKIAIFLTMTVLIMSIVFTWIAFAVEVNQLKYETASLQNRMQQHEISFQQHEISFQHASQNYSSIIQLLIQASFKMFLQQASPLASITQLLTNNGQELNTAFEEILQQVNGSNTALESKIKLLQSFSIAPSCASLPPYSLSGYYLVRASNGSAVRVYCDMTRTCGGVTGGWIRVAHLNSGHQCPSGLREYFDSYLYIRTCAPYNDLGTCSSVLYGSHGIHYSQVCGKIRGYQIGRTNGFYYRSSAATVYSNYVDGISLTHGFFPTQHIWTFAAHQACGCGNPPLFINNNYFCDGNTTGFYLYNPIWDGKGCTTTCSDCTFNNPPWFHRQLPQPTTDDIEMRLCRDERRNNEDIRIEVVEIYVQ